MKIGVICGFQGEIDCFQRALHDAELNPDNFSILPSGSSSARAREAAQHLLDEGCEKLLSFGVAGGLDPALRVGDVIFSNHVVTSLDESYGTRPSGEQKKIKMRASNQTLSASVCGVDMILFTPAEKAALYTTSHASAADMESHAVAREAQTRGLPFFIMRVISDGAGDKLPAFVAKAVNAAGQPQVMPILKGLAVNPFSLPQLLKLKKNTDQALSSLQLAATRILPTLVR